MVLEKERYMDRLFWFNWFKQAHSRYLVIQKEKLQEFGETNDKYFASLHVENGKIREIGEKVIAELKENKKQLSKKDLQIVLTYQQAYLDKVYDKLEDEFANDCWSLLHPSIPKIQNTIRDLIRIKNENEKELTFESWFFHKQDIQPCLSALQNVKPAIINEKYEYILGLHDKGAITAWVSILHKFNYVRFPGNELTASIINAKIKKLNITDRTLRTPNTKAYNRYLKDLQYHIPRK